MRSQSFKELLASCGPDVPRTPMLSREERLTKSMPPVVVELLEQRRLMALSVEMDGTSLVVTGSSGADHISVYINPSVDSIYVSDGTNTYGAYYQGTVTLVKILAGAGNDSIYIDDDNSTLDGTNALPESALIYGEGGNDRIYGGNLADTVYGGDGDDLEYGGADNDFMYGGNGYDTLYGDDGNDTIGGDADNDVLTGNAGNDSMAGGSGDDTFWARDSEVDTIAGNTGLDCAQIDTGSDIYTDIDGLYP